MASITNRKWTYKGTEKSAWQVRWRDVQGRARARTCATFSEAQECQASLGGPGVGRPPHVKIEDPTIHFLCAEYKRWLSEKLNDGRIGYSYWYSTRRMIDTKISAPLGRHQLSEIDVDLLTNWHRGLSAHGAMAPRTARNIVRVLKGIFDFAQRRRWATYNPASDLLVELRGIPTSKVRTFSLDEIRLLLAVADKRDADASFRERKSQNLLRCLIHLGAFCGLRIGEMLALDVRSLDLENGIISIRRSITPSGKIKAPKTAAGVRDVPMPRHLVRMLKEWVSRYHRAGTAGLVFQASSPGAVSRAFVGTRWRAMLEKSGLAEGKSLHFHALRHFCASWMIDNGWSLPEVAKIMGHTQISMTLQTYAHALQNVESQKPAMQELADKALLNDVARLTGPRRESKLEGAE